MKSHARYALMGICLALVSGVFADDPGAGGTITQTASKNDELKVFQDPSGQEYFPKNGEILYGADIGSRRLLAMKEPSVMAPLEKGVDRVFRMVLMPTFDEQVVVRVVQKGGNLVIRAVRMTLNGKNYAPLKIVHDKTWTLDEPERKTVLAFLQKKDAWVAMNDQEKFLVQSCLGLDGTSCLYEIHDHDGYHMIELMAPDRLAGYSQEQIREMGVDPAKIRDFSLHQSVLTTLVKMAGGKLQ